MYLVINKWVIAVNFWNFSGQYLRNHWTLDTGVLGYIVIVWPKEHSPEVWSVPPVTPCIYLSPVSQSQILISTPYSSLILGAFAKLRKANISFVTSVCPSVCPHGTTPLPLDGFHKICYIRVKLDPTRCNSMQVFIYCKITLHVSGVHRTHHQEYTKF